MHDLMPIAEADSSLQTVCHIHNLPFNDQHFLVQCTQASPWIPFMAPMGVIKHLDTIVGSPKSYYMLDDADQTTVNVILDTLVRLSTDTEVLTELQHRLRGLIAIRSFLHQKATLDALLLQIINTRLPLGCDSLPLTAKQSPKVSDITLVAQQRWTVRSAHLPLDISLVSTFLELQDWDETIAKTISGSIYKSSASRRQFWDWLFRIEPSQAPSLPLVVIPLRACLDVGALQGEDEMTQFPNAWLLSVIQYLFHHETSDNLRTLCASCIWLVFHNFPSCREPCTTFLSKEVQYGNFTSLTPQSMRLLCDLHRLDSEALSPVLIEATDKTLKWMVNQFSGVELADNDIAALNELRELPLRHHAEESQLNLLLAHLVSFTETKAHLVEPVLKAAIQNCLHMPRVVNSLPPLLSTTHLKVSRS
jgi:hypothetical protein